MNYASNPSPIFGLNKGIKLPKIQNEIMFIHTNNCEDVNQKYSKTEKLKFLRNFNEETENNTLEKFSHSQNINRMNSKSCQCEINITNQNIKRNNHYGCQCDINNTIANEILQAQISDDTKVSKLNNYISSRRAFFSKDLEKDKQYLKSPKDNFYYTNLYPIQEKYNEYEPYYNYYPSRMINYSKKKQEKIGYLRQRFLSVVPKYNSTEKTSVKFNASDKVIVSRLIDFNKQHCDETNEHLKKFHKNNRNDQKVKFLSHDFSKFKNNEARNLHEINKFKESVYGFDKIINQFSHKLTFINLNSDKENEFNNEDYKNPDYNFDREVHTNVKICDVKPFDLSYNKKSWTEKKVNKYKSLFGNFDENNELKDKNIHDNINWTAKKTKKNEKEQNETGVNTNASPKLKGPDFKKQIERIAHRSFLNMPIKAYDPKNKEELSSSSEVIKYLHKINKELIQIYDDESIYKKLLIPRVSLRGPNENDILQHLNSIQKIAEMESEEDINLKQFLIS